jgi:Signal transduction histidine kinase
MRRYRQYQMDHIIRELHYIAQGHLDHRIPFKLNGSLQDVITSVNTLVDSVVQSMDDERQVEKSKDELITNVSHDLRTPLTSIIGYLGLIENKQYHNEQDILQYNHIAYEKAVQMKGMVDDLFEFTKVQQHGAPLNFMKVDLDPLLEQVSASFELEAEKKELRFPRMLIPNR